jgi:hypothetical protein
MAYSIDGIPALLLPSDARLLFLQWVAVLPILDNAKRRLLTTWRTYNHAAFTVDDYRLAGLAPGSTKPYKVPER